MKLLEVVLNNITGPFEGGGYDNVSSNFDGMGISAGILQWCYGQGSLQEKILKPFIKAHGSIDALRIFPLINDAEFMDRTANMDSTMAKKFAAVHMNNVKGIFNKKYSLKSEWAVAWKKFLSLPEVIQIQKNACEALDINAKSLCSHWGLKSTMAYCWMFDILTQNGSLLDLQKPAAAKSEISHLISKADSANKKEWNKINLDLLSEEQVVLFIASYLRASKSRSQYIQDVFSRKGTIALGIGYVHGGKFDLQMSYAIVTSDSIT